MSAIACYLQLSDLGCSLPGKRRVATSKYAQQTTIARRHQRRVERKGVGKSTCGVTNSSVNHNTVLTIQRKRGSKSWRLKPKQI